MPIRLNVSGIAPLSAPEEQAEVQTRHALLAIEDELLRIEGILASLTSQGPGDDVFIDTRSHDPLTDKDLGDQHHRYVYLYPGTDARNTIVPTATALNDMCLQLFGNVGFEGQVLPTGWTLTGMNALLFKNAGGSSTIMASNIDKWLAITSNRVFGSKIADNIALSTSEFFFWPRNTTAVLTQPHVYLRHWEPTHDELRATLGCYPGSDGKGLFVFGGDFANPALGIPTEPQLFASQKMGRITVLNAPEKVINTTTPEMHAIKAIGRSGDIDVYPFSAELDHSSLEYSNPASWDMLYGETPAIRPAANYYNIYRSRISRFFNHGPARGSGITIEGHWFHSAANDGKGAGTVDEAWGIDNSTPETSQPTLYGGIAVISTGVEPVEQSDPPGPLRIDCGEYLWLNTNLNIRSPDLDDLLKCHGGIRMANYYTFGIDRGNGLIKVHDLKVVDGGRGSGWTEWVTVPDAEVRGISGYSVDTTGIVADLDSVYVRQDGTSPGAVTQRQSFTNGISTPTGIGGGIILNAGTDTVQLYESAGAALLKIDASNSFFWSVAAGIPYYTMPATGVLQINTTTLKINELKFNPTTHAAFTIDVTDALLVKSDNTTEASGSRAILAAQAAAGSTRTIFEARQASTSYLTVIANAATPGVSSFKSSNGAMATTSGVGWTFNTGAGIIGTVYDFQNNTGSLLKLASTGATVGTNLYLPLNSRKIIFGTGNDAEIYYDATDLVIDPRVVLSTGSVKIPGNIPLHLPGTTSAPYDTSYIDFGNVSSIPRLIFRGVSGVVSNFIVEAPTGQQLALNVSSTSAAFNSGSVQLSFSNTSATNPITFDTLGANIVFNNTAFAVDCQFKGDTDVNLLYTKASTDTVGVGLAAPAAKLHVDQSSATGAKPVLALDQGDIDDSFIDFIGTSAADGTRSISSDTTEDSAKFGAIRVEINGVTKWIRVYDDES